MADGRTVHVVITGRVQGVGYRAWLEAEAMGLELDGWVRNRRDGSVEAMLSGDPLIVAEMLAACEEGPPAAVVEKVAVEDTTRGLANEGFRVLPTE